MSDEITKLREALAETSFQLKEIDRKINAVAYAAKKASEAPESDAFVIEVQELGEYGWKSSLVQCTGPFGTRMAAWNYLIENIQSKGSEVAAYRITKRN